MGRRRKLKYIKKICFDSCIFRFRHPWLNLTILCSLIATLLLLLHLWRWVQHGGTTVPSWDWDSRCNRIFSCRRPHRLQLAISWSWRASVAWDSVRETTPSSKAEPSGSFDYPSTVVTVEELAEDKDKPPPPSLIKSLPSIINGSKKKTMITMIISKRVES